VIRQLGVLLGAVAALAVTATAAQPPLDVAAPSPAQRSTAKLVLMDGSGAQRLALWRATNPRAELCVGWAVATTKPPKQFACLRRGLERPVLAVETGGGLGGQATWGIIAGLVSPVVSRLSAETAYGTLTTRDLTLRRVAGLRGWRAFTTGVLDHPPSTTLKAYDAGGRPLVDSSGAVIHPSTVPGGTVTIPGGTTLPVAVATPPGQPPSGPAWTDSGSMLGETPALESAISTVLAGPSLRSLVSTHPAWIESGGTWFACNARRIGSVLTVRFASPVSFTANLPVVVRPSGPFAYAVAIDKVAVSSARELTVWVDASLAQVVGVRPTAWPMTSGPGPATTLATISAPHDQGGPDSSDCWQSSG
jgi:hypothetical protein